MQAFEPLSGKVCEGLQLPVRAGRCGGLPGQVLSLTLIRLDAERLMAVLDDITEQLQRERALRDSRAWLHGLVRGSQDYAWLSLDGDGRVADWNPSVQRITGHGPGALSGRPFTAIVAADAGALAPVDALAEADASGWLLEEGWLQRADGSRAWGSALIAPRHPPGERDRDERGYSLIVRDMSGQREAIESLRRAVSTDHLTGLANRRAFFEAAQIETARCRRQGLPLAVVVFDADHFKAVNDGHGHAAGDRVLRHLASTLAASFREVDVVARLGGEEFVVLMPGAGAREAEAAAQRACELLRRQPADLGGSAISCTMSAGYATLQPDDDVDGLLQRADAALYAAKAAGRDRVCGCPAAGAGDTGRP